MNKQLDLGALIRKKLEEQDRSIAWLAKKLSCDRSNLRRMLQKHDIPPSTIRKISDILHYDFFRDCLIID